MANKRSARRKVKKFLCPFCQKRLWRQGTEKYRIFYQNADEIRKNTGIPAKKAKLLANQSSTYLDMNKWVEAFCCSDHGLLWLYITQTNKNIEYRLAKEEDWSRTDKTIDPRLSNPSVSEFTLRMSRKLR